MTRPLARRLLAFGLAAVLVAAVITPLAGQPSSGVLVFPGAYPAGTRCVEINSSGQLSATSGTCDAAGVGTAVDAGEITAAAIDGDDLNSNIAGRSLTLTAASPDTLDADVELYTRGFSFVLEDPVAGDSGELQTEAWVNLTITQVRCSTDTGTATININERAEATPNTTGTDVLSAGLVCDTNSQDSCASGCDVNTITNGPIDQNDPIALEIDSVASTPGWVRVHVRYTVDD